MTVHVRVPATSANLGSGVDCLGVALSLYLDVSFSGDGEDASSAVFSFSDSEGNPFVLSDDDNLIRRTLLVLEEKYGVRIPAGRVTVRSQIPLSRGLGSSSSAIVAAVLGGFVLLGKPADKSEILSVAAEIEGHPDNVAPALLGGFTAAVTGKGNAVLAKKLRVSGLIPVVAVPEFELSTREMRAVLPSSVPMKNAVRQVQRASLLTAALESGDWELLEEATEDVLFTPARKTFMPYLDRVFSSGREAGARCCMISGAGPSVLAFASRPGDAARIREAWTDAFRAEHISADVRILSVAEEGAIVRITEGE